MNNFNANDYNDIDEGENQKETAPREVTPLKIKSNFNANDYNDVESETNEIIEQESGKEKTNYQKSLEFKVASPKEWETMTPERRKSYTEDYKNRLMNPVPNAMSRGVLSALSFGHSEKLEGLETGKYGGKGGEIVGKGIGSTAWIYATRGIASPFQALSGLPAYGRAAKIASGAIDIAGSAAHGLLYGAVQEVGSGRAFTESPGDTAQEIAKEGVLFGVLHGALKAVKGGYNWIKSLGENQTESLAKGLLPENLTENQYKFYTEEIYPAVQEEAKLMSTKATEEAMAEIEKSFKQDMSKARAEHENDLMELEKNNQLSEESFQGAQKQHQQEMQNYKAKYENKLQEVQRQNQEAQQMFEQQNQEFQQMQNRNRIVQSHLNSQMQSETPQQPWIQAPTNEMDNSIANEIGNIFSPNKVRSNSELGAANQTAIQANDAVDYSEVNRAYTLSEQLNSQVQTIHQNLSMNLLDRMHDIARIPSPSQPQRQLQGVITEILRNLVVMNEEGAITGFIPMGNRVLQEQAKSLRSYMDFNFQHGNMKGEFTPVVNAIEDAIDFAATSTGNIQAADANDQARALYRQWALDYNNDYIRPYRDTTNHSHEQLFESSLNIDNFRMVDNILNRSNAGQRLSGITKRSLIEKELSKFIDNPNTARSRHFDDTLNNLNPILSPNERSQIQDVFFKPTFHPRRVSNIEQPEPPSLKPEPIAENIPLLAKKSGAKKEITEVKVPVKEKLKPTKEMLAAEKILKMKPGQLQKLANTPDGFHELKGLLSTSPNKEKLYEKIGKQKIMELMNEGNIKKNYTGKELFNVINKGRNYEMFSAILGEDAAQDLLITTQELSDKQFTVENVKKLLKSKTLKVLIFHGLFL